MSHFTVLVRVTEARLEKHDGDLHAALDEMMAPYEESPEKGSPFLVFESHEEKARTDYENETTEAWRLADGRVVGRYDDAARALKLKESDLVEMPFKERYKTFDEFATNYHGYGKDPETGHYGYWMNPNAKWDWWQIGGRWRGYFPLKSGVEPVVGPPGAFDNVPDPGHGDVVRVSDIDMEQVEVAARLSREKFWAEWRALLDRKKFDSPFEGPRSKALDIGLLDVVRGPAIPSPKTKVMPWKVLHPDVNDERRDWCDVAKLVTYDEFVREYSIYFDKISTYAALDDEGWHQPGQMGWWACTDATPESSRKFLEQFRARMIDACGPNDLLVVIDAHI